MGLEIALANATGEITLVVFTTLGPASALAYLIMLIPFFAPHRGDEEKARVRKQLWIPLVLCMCGLISSATHLGNPANALYVLSHVGESPLSNEILAASAFLACAALFWLSGFALRPRRAFDLAVGVLVVVTGIVFIFAVAFAYNVETILTWSQPAVPASIVLSAFVAGPLLATFCLAFSESQSTGLRFERIYLCSSAVASLLWIACQVCYGLALQGVGNALFSAMELVGGYWACLALACVLLVASFALSGFYLLRHGRVPSLARVCASAVCALAAIFIMRFLFYMAHMTVGVAI